MDAKEYQQRADACLAQVADWLESFDPDEVDYSTTDGVVTIEFPDRVRYVLNRQAAASQGESVGSRIAGNAPSPRNSKRPPGGVLSRKNCSSPARTLSAS